MPTLNNGQRFMPSNCELPNEGVTAIRFEATFAGNTIDLSLREFFENHTLSFAQTLYFYNPNALTIIGTSLDVNQTFQLPANKQGYFPIMCGTEGNFSFQAVGNGAGKVLLFFLNVPVYPIIFDTLSF